MHSKGKPADKGDSDKKTSQNSNDMFHIMAGIAVNLLEGVVSQLQFIRVRPND